ncbi:MAG TPA: hypothetical protein VJM32_01810 [Candidatus Saccharimonadales bacterium]|nr:hypothetical protein [Candidatus Saccharimonadales bacterium]
MSAHYEARHAAEAAPEPASLADQLAEADELLARHPLTESFADRIEQDTLLPEEEAAYNAVADGIFDSIGVVGEEAVEPWEAGYDNMGTSVAILRLNRAADVAAAADEFDFSRDAPDEDLRTSTSTILDALGAVQNRAANDRSYRESREHRERSRALTLLAEAGARELGRRNDVGDDLTSGNLRAIQEATGVRLVESEPHSAIFRGRITPRPYRSRDTGRHHQRHNVPRARASRSASVKESHDYYRIPELAGPNVPHRNGWVPGRIGHFALDPRYTSGRLPR